MRFMTATTTPAAPKELLADYRRDARAAARAAGAPQDRAAFPGIGLEPTGMIYRSGRRLMYQPVLDKARELDHPTLTNLLSSPHTCTVVADRDTFESLHQVGLSQPEEEYGSIAKRLKAVKSLPVSVRMPILTDALAYRYWLPEGLDEKSFDDWAASFGKPGPTRSAAMRHLIDKATDGLHSVKLKNEMTVGRLRDAEVRLMEQCVWGGTSSDVQVFGMVESYTSKANGLRHLDPGLLEYHVLDGTVCKIGPMNETSEDFSASASQPFKLKENSKLRMTDGAEVCEVLLTSLRYGSGELHAVFSQPSARSNGASLIRSAKMGLRPLYVAAGIFDLPPGFPRNRKWLSGTAVERVEGRTVPLDVILAGAPVA